MVKVVEVFDSIQGEGILTGVPTTFVRLLGCNLSCRWCDTKYAKEGDGEEMSPQEILGKVKGEHVCITGGEPLMQDIYELCRLLFDGGKKVTVETNCTVYDKRLSEFVFLYSVSPKLSASGERYDERVLRKYLNLDNVQIKFVVCDDDDFLEARGILEKYRKSVRDKIILQPDGMCPLNEYSLRLSWLVGKVLTDDVMLKNNVRVLPQLHKVIWGNKRGV
ncbi:MAG: 7-carboxy-7-deazaguanine synthase QueE [archaeon]